MRKDADDWNYLSLSGVAIKRDVMLRLGGSGGSTGVEVFHGTSDLSVGGSAGLSVA